MKDTESILIQQLKDGDEKAYEKVFFEYYELLAVFANKFLNDIEASKEVIQDLFVNLFEKKDNLKIESSIKSYLYKAVHNRCLNIINHEKYIRKHADYVKKIKNNNSDNHVENTIRLAELENIIYGIINQLPPKCQEIFKMNRFEGKNNGEIAEQLGLSKRTVETQISKALKLLRHKLNGYDLNYNFVTILFVVGYVLKQSIL